MHSISQGNWETLPGVHKEDFMSEKKKELRSDEIEKLRIKYSFFKFLLGTFAISLLTAV